MGEAGLLPELGHGVVPLQVALFVHKGEGGEGDVVLAFVRQLFQVDPGVVQGRFEVGEGLLLGVALHDGVVELGDVHVPRFVLLPLDQQLDLPVFEPCLALGELVAGAFDRQQGGEELLTECRVLLFKGDSVVGVFALGVLDGVVDPARAEDVLAEAQVRALGLAGDILGRVVLSCGEDEGERI